MKRTVLTLTLFGFMGCPPSNDQLSVRAKFSDTRPANIAFTPNGRLFLTQHPLDNPRLRVVEVLEDGTKVPFPTEDWSDGPETGEVGIAATVGIKSDSNGVVWILDMGDDDAPARFVAWDTKIDALHKIIDIPKSVVHPISFLQDFALDEVRRKIYIADMTFTESASDARPAFIVVDMDTGKARRVLEAEPRLMASDRDVVINGSLVGFKDELGEARPWHLPLNGISIDPSFEFVYFSTINGDDIFRIPSEDLANDSLNTAALSEKIERYGEKAPNDGIIVDAKGRVFTADVERNAVTVTTKDRFEVFAKDDELLKWADGFALAPDGSLYAVANKLNTHPDLNLGKDGSDYEYYIVKISEPATSLIPK